MDPRPAKKAKRKVVKKKQKKTKRLSSTVESIWTCGRFPECFTILPPHLFHPRISHLLTFCTASLKQQSSVIKSVSVCPFQSKLPATNDMNAFWSPILARELGKAVVAVRKSRRLFKILLHHWRVKHLKKANEEDIVSGQTPKHPIYIIDWQANSVYVFEASTLARDMMERLLCHDGLWIDSQAPRNPLTNIPLTQAQTISVYQQLSRSPVQLGWAVTAFRKVRYDLNRFLLEYDTPIQLHAYRHTMRNRSHEDYKERMLDFIQYAYDQEAIDCLVTSYAYALQHFPENPIMVLWSHICFKFYEAPLLYYKNPQGLQTFQDALLNQTIPLLTRQKELRQLRLAHLKLSKELQQ